MKEVQWTEIARKTLQETSDFILELWNENVNKEFVAQLDYRITQLQNNPELGLNFENTQIRLLVIWDNRQDPDRLLKKLTDANNS